MWMEDPLVSSELLTIKATDGSTADLLCFLQKKALKSSLVVVMCSDLTCKTAHYCWTWGIPWN